MSSRMPDTGQAGRPDLRALAWVIARDVNRTFGGGIASSEVLRRTLVGRGWITDEDHRRLYALSRLTPGTNLPAYCTALGWQTRGARGAGVAWLAVSVPCSLVAAVVTVLYDRLAASPTLGFTVLIGMSLALILLVAGAWQLARPQVSRAAAPRSALIVLLALGLVALGAAPLPVLLIAAAIGAAWP